ncbi:MAG: hypothetical protein PHC68_16100 [Syntrophorhabdaceae bacterium]|nr:hypothetical protein [Syntrophorhabdaceae bacterium]
MTNFILAVAIGIGLACFFFWLRDELHVIGYKIEHIIEERHDPTRHTGATGDDCDPDGEDVRGSIGFRGNK